MSRFLPRLIAIGEQVQEIVGLEVHIDHDRHPVSRDIIYLLSAKHQFADKQEVIEVRVNEGYFWLGGEDRWIVYQFYCLAYHPPAGRDLVLVDPDQWPSVEQRRQVSVALRQPGGLTRQVAPYARVRQS